MKNLLLILAALCLCGCDADRKSLPPGYTVWKSGDHYRFSTPTGDMPEPIGGYDTTIEQARKRAWTFSRGYNGTYISNAWLPVEGKRIEELADEAFTQKVISVMDKYNKMRRDEFIKSERYQTNRPPFPNIFPR